MLVWMLDRLAALWPGVADFRAMEKITFRGSLAAVASFALALWIGPRLIAWLRGRFREPIDKSPSERVRQLHAQKQWTPTMGGLFIVAGLATSVLAFADLANPFVPIALVTALALAGLGAADDLAKLTTASAGLRARTKLLAQLAIAGVAALLLYRVESRLPGGLDLAIPFTGAYWPIGWWFVPLATLVITASSNAVNLADGLDGLAGGCLIFATAAMGVLVYAGGHSEWAKYLNVPQIPGAGEMLIVAGGLIGAVLGFLWFNCHPASVFMGDTGSLPLGGLLGLLAVIARQELLLIVVGGVFVAEAASVIVQVGWYRWKKKRLFLCAPLHHHFQFQGWPENKIVVRFWIAAALCALLGLASLKFHFRENPREPMSLAERLYPGWKNFPPTDAPRRNGVTDTPAR